MATGLQGLHEEMENLRVLFPGDSSEVVRFFAAAVLYERKGEIEKANNYFDKALKAEEKANS
jgi:Tfp pilus assembly protein PilF